MVKHVAPDGGHGWVITTVFGLNNIIVIPVVQSFNLLFRYVLQDLKMSTTDISMITNVNSAFGLLLGLAHGPLLKRFGYRKVAMFGTILMSVSFALTSTASSFTEFIIYYGIFNSIGFSISLVSFSLALNTYFDKNRKLAYGICTAVTGLGPVIMPIVMSLLIGMYGERGTALILAGISFHSFAGSLLLHPVKWHYRKAQENASNEKEMEQLNPPPPDTKSIIEKEKDNVDSQDVPEESEECYIQLVEGLEKVITTKTIENGGGLFASKLSLYEKDPDITQWRKSSSVGLLPFRSHSSMRQDKKKKKMKSNKWMEKIVKLFDLDLLKDSGYVSILCGMALAFMGDINFSLMTPLFLDNMGWNVEETAHFMSSSATADIIMRFILPLFSSVLKLSSKQLFMIGILLTVLTRFIITLVQGWTQTMITCIAIGLAKGFSMVYIGLIVPDYVPLEKLPSAQGIQTVVNGLALVFAAPIIGFIGDVTHDYNWCIHFINCFTLVAVIIWSIEMLIARRKMKNTQVEI